MKQFDCHMNFEGRFYYVERGCSEVSYSFGFQRSADAIAYCRQFLRTRPHVVFCSVVVGGVLVASAGVFPWADSRVSMAPLAC